MWPLATRVLGEEYNETFTLKAGFKLNAYLGDQLGRLALFYGPNQTYFWEPSTTQLLEKLVPDADNIVVAGSHVGLTALYARNAMKKDSATVHTFEPIEHLFELSGKHFELNKELGNIMLTKAALGDVPAHVTMTRDRIRSRIITAGQNSKNLDTEDVPVTTIDSYCASRSVSHLDVVFLDVEGYEYNALKGMEGLLKKQPPRDIIYEISFPKKDNLAAATKIQTYLSQFGYDFYLIEEGYDPTYYRHTQPPVSLLPGTPTAYESYKQLRYFNMYATLRSVEEVTKIAQILPA